MKRCLLVLVLGFCSYLQALPTSGKIVKGEASISKPHSKAININAHGKAIIHWDQFNIDSSESVSFVQSQPKMAVLNRVTRGSFSKILGHLKADCPIYLINGRGIFIGDHAQIHTAGFIASTADISNESFWGQKDLAFQNLKEGEIVNLGTISCTEGDVILIARSITNSGTIRAPQWQVTLTTTEIVIHPDEKKQVFIRPNLSEEGISNLGTIEAQAVHLETSSPYTQAINHNGKIKAYQSVEKGGRIHLVADQGGIECTGELTAKGGRIDIEAKDIAIRKGSLLETSSPNAGGSISLAGTRTTRVDEGAKLCAKSGPQGDKGKASILTKQGTFTILGDVNADEILYDPKFVSIQSGGADYDPNNPPRFNDGIDTATISWESLQSSLNAGNVTSQADTDISFNYTSSDDVVNVTTRWNGLTLEAGRSISIEGKLTFYEGDFSATINDQNATVRDSGVASFSMVGLSFNPAEIVTNGGNISIDVGTYGSQQEGELHLSSGHMDAGGGNISLNGYGRLDGINNGTGVVVSDYSQLKTSGYGTITLTGKGGNGESGSHGVYIPSDTVLLEGVDGTITINGTGGGSDLGNMNSGFIHAGTLQTTGSGNIELDGTAVAGNKLNTGICFVSGGSATVVNGNLTLNGIGTSTGNGNQNYGIRFESESFCSSTGSGSIQLTGSSSGGVDNNHGVTLSNSHIESASGAISLQGSGQGSGDYNHGVRLESMASISSTDTATLTIQGDNNGGVNRNIGVSISSDQDALSSVYGDVTVVGTSSGTGGMNQGVRLDGGKITSTETGAYAANISLTGTCSSAASGSSEENVGVDVGGYQVGVTSMDGNITITGYASGDNAPYTIDTDVVESTGSGSVTYYPPQT